MLGVTAQAVQQWEAGKTSPRGHRLRDVAAALGVTVEHLLYGDGSGLTIVSAVRKFITKPDANVEQVRRGMAWVFDRYVTDRSLYAVQDEARAARRGLWADPDPVPPWEWRRLKH